jgi:hypothetical protein
MPSSACVLWVVFISSASFQLGLAAPASFRPISEHVASERGQHARADSILAMMQPTRSIEFADGSAPDSRLLPVSEVFKMMNDKSEMAVPTTSPIPSVSVPLSSSTTFTDSQSTESTSRIFGPGLLVPTPLAGPELTPPSNIAAQSVKKDQHSAPVHKLILLGCVIGGIVVFSLLMFLVFTCRICNASRREKKTALAESKISPFYEAQKDDKSDFSTESLDTSAWLKFPPPSVTYRQNDKQAALLSPPNPRVISKVIDITPDFPRSKFSITSSDYAQSLRSSVNSSNVSMLPVPIAGEEASEPSALLTPSEFFSLPSSTDLRRSLSSRHSRNHSAPVFGHDVSLHTFLPGMMRAGDHRKSKSISGLVYRVGKRVSVSASSHRRSSLSSRFSHYKGTPPMNGFLSAPDY